MRKAVIGCIMASTALAGWAPAMAQESQNS
ncbi:MAG: hypothetical protein RLZZ104_120, partial [Pseudomonadota bacterium]